MTESQFNTQIENQILRTSLLEVNRIMGTANATSYLSTGLFMRVPIQVCAEQQPNEHEEKKLSVETLHNIFYASLDTTTTPFSIKFSFLYSTPKQLKHIAKVVAKYPTYLTFQYMKQLQHIVRKHYTPTFQAMCHRVYGNRPQPIETINHAMNAVVCTALHSLFINSPLAANYNNFSHLLPSTTHETEVDYLTELAANTPAITVDYRSDRANTVIIDGFKFISPINQPIVEFVESQISNLAQTVTTLIQDNCHGTAGSDTFSQAFEAITVDTSWFANLETVFSKQVDEKTNIHYQTWDSLDPTYRHLFKAPNAIHLQESIKLILSLDQSGSMAIRDMQKILGMMEEHSDTIEELIVLVHDTGIAYSTKLTSEFGNIMDHPEFYKALAERKVSGGTSHLSVLEYIRDMNISDPSKYIYISFSDNYSDIEQYPDLSPQHSGIDTFWLAPSDSRPINIDLVGGHNILLP